MPAGTEAAYAFSHFPSVGAYKREVPFQFVEKGAANGVQPGSVTLAMTENTEGATPFFSEVLSPEDEHRLSEDKALTEFIELNETDQSATVALTWLQEAGGFAYPPVICEERITHGYSAQRGEPVSIRYENYSSEVEGGAGLLIRSCDLAKPGRISVTIIYHKRHYVQYENNACDYNWFGPNPPGLRVYSASEENNEGERTPDGIYLATTGTHTTLRFYSVIVRDAGKLIGAKILEGAVYNTPTTDVYEGTDAFVNYCIDDNHKLYSHNLRLYCIRPGSLKRFTTFSG